MRVDFVVTKARLLWICDDHLVEEECRKKKNASGVDNNEEGVRNNAPTKLTRTGKRMGIVRS